MLHRLLLVSLLALLLAFIAACSPFGDDDANTDLNDEEPTAESVLSQAADQWDETESLHFELEATGDSYLDSAQTVRLLTASGDLARPESVEAEARVSVSIATVNVNIIVVGDDAYMTNLVTGAWEHAPDDFNYNPALLFNPDDGLGPIMQDIRNAELEDSESIEGRQAHRVTGYVSEQQIRDITAGSIVGEDIEVTIWVAEDNHEVLRLFLRSPSEDAGEPTTWDLVFTDHNQDVTIEEPI
jgi:hypothetical protein